MSILIFVYSEVNFSFYFESIQIPCLCLNTFRIQVFFHLILVAIELDLGVEYLKKIIDGQHELIFLTGLEIPH